MILRQAKEIGEYATRCAKPIADLNCIHVKTRDSFMVRAKAVYLALGVKMAGEKDILELWMGPTEGLFYALRYS